MLLDVREWNYARCKGQVVSYVAKGRGIPDRIIKSIWTTVSKGNLNLADFQRMLAEIESESVMPFLRAPWNQPERLKRFQTVSDSLIGSSNSSQRKEDDKERGKK